jgi:type II secretory pathway component PulM
MGISTWLKERRLERTHQKLKHLRAFQAKLRDQENDLVNQRKAGAPSTELEAKQNKIHAEREALTRQIHELQAAEEKLKAELKMVA